MAGKEGFVHLLLKEKDDDDEHERNPELQSFRNPMLMVS